MAHFNPGRIGEARIFGLLPQVEIANALRRQFQSRFGFRRTSLHGRVNLIIANAQSLGVQCLTVIFFRQRDERVIAALAHIINNGGHRLIDIDRLLTLHRLQRRKTAGKILIINMGAQKAHNPTLPNRAADAMMRPTAR